MTTYQLSELQANAILDMKLQRLTSLETEKLKGNMKRPCCLLNDAKRFWEVN